MSWLFSRALVEEYSAERCSDGELCAQLNVSPTPQAYLQPDRMTEFSRLSRFGMTFAPLTADRGVAVLMLFLAAFPVRPIPQRLREKTLRTISGRRCDGSWQMSLPGTYLPRTSKDARSIAQQMTLKRWVTSQELSNFQPPSWVRLTFGRDIGFLHTPTATANYASPSMQKWPGCRAFVAVFGKPTPSNHEWLMGWPLGWSALQPLETVKFLSWQQQHGIFSQPTTMIAENDNQPSPDNDNFPAS
jgi:hypothetical protein